MPPACFLYAPTPYGWNKIVAMAENVGGSKPPPYGGAAEEVRKKRQINSLIRLASLTTFPQGKALRGRPGGAPHLQVGYVEFPAL